MDFHLPIMDFGADDFVSQAIKDVQHRKNGQVQTFRFGRDSIVLRIYNKSDEVKEQSGKYWLHSLWGYEEDVWRIEYQIRKDTLREFGISALANLLSRYGVLLAHLAHEHTRLTTPSAGSTAHDGRPIPCGNPYKITTPLFQSVFMKMNSIEVLISMPG